MIFFEICGCLIGIDDRLYDLVQSSRYVPFRVASNGMRDCDLIIVSQPYVCDVRVRQSNYENSRVSFDFFDGQEIASYKFGGLSLSAYISEDASRMTIPTREMVDTYGKRILEYFFSKLFIRVFRRRMIRLGAFPLHASAVLYQGKCILFSGISGIGKSTQARLWEQVENAEIINHDSPMIKCISSTCIAYGNPWSGSDNCYVNVAAPVAGMFILSQADHCSIESITRAAIVRHLLSQSLVLCENKVEMDMLAALVEKASLAFPTYILRCTPTPESVNFAKEALLYNA